MTATLALPGARMSAAVISASNTLGDTNVVVRVEPFHKTTEVVKKFTPLTVTEKFGPAAGVEFGLRLFTTGAVVWARATEALNSRSNATLQMRLINFGRAILNMLIYKPPMGNLHRHCVQKQMSGERCRTLP